MKMYRVEEGIKEKASKCRIGRICLSQPKHDLCPVKYFFEEEDTLFVKEREGRKCEYFLPHGIYGLSGICRCPVRRELYKSYQI